MQRRYRYNRQTRTALGLGSAAAVVLLLTLVFVVLRRPIQPVETSDPVEESVSEWSEAVTTLLWRVDPEHPLPAAYVPASLRKVKGSDVQLVEEAARAFERMTADMDEPISAANGYISSQAQQNLYDTKLQQYLDNGYTRERAELAIAAEYLPGGQDEHQLGLTVDVCANSELSLDYGFRSTEQGKWLRDNAWKYGFVYRDRMENESVYQPWQLRYVGEVHAELMNSLGMPLDEYLPYLADKKTSYFSNIGAAGLSIVVYYSDTLEGIREKIKEVSGDNEGHYIIVCYQ